jgi:hypothetical protein
MAAVPPDVRKAFGFPASDFFVVMARLSLAI